MDLGHTIQKEFTIEREWRRSGWYRKNIDWRQISAIFKSPGKDGKFYNGSVGKGFGYGAQQGLLIAQGDADARAGIRLSGADMIIGGLLKQPLPRKGTRKYAVKCQY